MAQGHEPKEKVVYVGDSRVKQYKKNTTPRDYSAYPGKTEAFIPNFLLKEWMVGAVVIVGYMALVIAHPSPLGYPADPNNAEFIPMPDWYFLFLYQLLKYPYLAEDFIVLGTLGIPGLAFGALLLAPFLDRGKDRKWFKRPVASALMLLSFIAVIYLTKVSWDHYTHEMELRGQIPEHVQRAIELAEERKAAEEGKVPRTQLPIVAEDSAGAQAYSKASCLQCHGADLKGKSGMPSLRGIGEVHTKEEIVEIIKNGFGGMAPQYDANINAGMTEDELDQLAQWLSDQKAPEADRKSVV